jgi:hypothetical protein
MSGQPGRSGRRRKSLAHHVMSGTYRLDRHGPLPPNLPAWPQTPSSPPPWQPSAEDVAGLGDAGRQFVSAMLEQYDFDLAQGVLLVEAARVLDTLTVWRAAAATDKSAARLAVQYTKTFAALVAQVAIR